MVGILVGALVGDLVGDLVGALLGDLVGAFRATAIAKQVHFPPDTAKEAYSAHRL
jgi:hypothetical protein